ncbi:MAG: YbeD family protein [Steroidobacteraceae bacterium]
MTDLKLLTFPVDYPIKVVGRADSLLRADIDAIMQRHVPDLDAALTSERYSENGNYLSISYTIVARSEAQVTALAAELAAQPHVIMLI